MIEKILKDKRILSLYIVVISFLFIGITYALGTYSMGISFNTALIRVDEEAYGNTTFDATNIDFKPIMDTDVETSLDNVIKIDFTVGGAEANNNSKIIYDIALADLEIHCDLISKYIKWKLIKDGTVISSSGNNGLDKGIKNQRLVLTENQIDLPNYSTTKSGYHNYTFYMWMSDSCQKSNLSECVGQTDQSSLIGKYFSGRIEVELYTKTKVGYGAISSRDNSETTKCLSDNPNRLNNAPNLDNGNLIPVYYDETGTYTYTDNDNSEITVTGVWKKADSKNSGNSWYDYENKMWANAVIIGDSTKKRQYQKSSIGTIINDEDITAFYVWIPRFKYRVCNITRQGGAESTYAYQAYTKGIDIEFETGRNSTGNVECTYDTLAVESETNLSDKCTYKGKDLITTTSGNANYKDAWYTHPAFTFGNKEMDGFWIGKFETTGEAATPTVLPDKSSLRSQNVSTQFTTSKYFQNYLSSDIDAHMLTNLEWGAVAYLTHSKYGLCNGTTCQGVYLNNSSGYYTGRSGGDIAGSTNLNLTTVYGSSVTTSTTKYNANGYYNYKGYKLDYSTGDATTTKDITKVASTTKNITGVYDMSGGAHEYVMGNMVDSTGVFYPSSSGTSWNGNTTLNNFYYNAYSYGTSQYGKLAFNRGRLGDATAEVLGGTSSTSAWKPGSGVTGSNSNFAYYSSSWFCRGGNYNLQGSGTFYFSVITGASYNYYSFRSSLS